MAATAIISGAQFDALPYEEGRKWELVDGELIPVSSTTLIHQRIVRELQIELGLYFRQHPTHGQSFSDVEFALGENYRVRPDVFVLLPGTLAAVNLEKVPIPGAPDMAIEVISPSERSVDSQIKVKAYLAHGTSEVWQVYPKLKSVVIHRGSTGATLGAADHIVTPLLPGFSLSVESLF